MSGWIDTPRLACSVEGVCPLYDPNPFFAPIFVLIDFYPTYLSAVITFLSLYSWEFIFAYLWVCIALDMAINVGLKELIYSTTRFPDCGSFSEMPSYASQCVILLNTMGICFVLLLNRNISSYKLVLLNIGTLSILLARVYIGINTIPELVVGGMIGFAEGIVYSVFLYRMRFVFAGILRRPLFLYMGLVDNVCNLDLLVTPKNYPVYADSNWNHSKRNFIPH